MKRFLSSSLAILMMMGSMNVGLLIGVAYADDLEAIAERYVLGVENPVGSELRSY